MMKKTLSKSIESNNFYHEAIHDAHQSAQNIHTPDINGAVAKVFMANVNGKPYVYRFNNPQLLMRNQVISAKMASKNVPMPRPQLHYWNKILFEIYPFMTEKTLTEHINSGASRAGVFNVYCDALKLQSKISRIPAHEMQKIENMHFYQVFRLSLQQRFQPWLAQFYSQMVRPISNFGKQLVLHTDITPANILVDKNGRFSSFLDLDAISVCNENFSLVPLLRSYPLDNTTELFDAYEEINRRKINRQVVLNTLDIMKKIRKTRRKFESKFSISDYHR